MGETDDIDPPPATTNGSTETTAAEESKETDKLLKEEKKAEVTTPASEQKPDDETTKKVNGEEIINIPEEKTDEKESEKEPKKKLSIEEREVKPKKIPVGGIKIPGFFTRNKDKSKGEGDGAENELLEKGDEDKTKEVEDAKEAAEKKPGLFDNIRERFGSLFAKKPATTEETEKKDDTTIEENQENKKNEEKDDADTVTADDAEKPSEEKAATPKPADEPESTASKKNLLGAIKLPTLGNLIPKRLKKSNQDDIELGNGPNNKAGLASMETLDDSQKDVNGDATNKDTTDKPVIATDESKMETIKLTDDKDAEKAAEAEKDRQKRPLLERIQGYRCSIDDLAIVGGVLLFIILVICILLFALSGNPAAKSAPVRDGKYVEAVTGCGNVEGLLEDSSFAFRGIPYAIPPLAENRWRPAELIDNIDYCWNGTFKAHNATPSCWQIFSDNSLDGVEDCLTLDVITPHVRYDNPLPVVVLIGADSFTGHSPGKLRPSARYARARDIVFVRPNFRLGVFGFLSLKQLSESTHPPTSGNYALSDIIAALKWIAMNIVHFGGDPNSVTLFGHKAGATLVTALLSSNKTKGLYSRAWISSGGARFPGRPLSDSEKQSVEYLRKVNCTDAECLRTKEDEDLLDYTPDEWRHTAPDLPSPSEKLQHEWLVLDGDILSQHPSDVWKSSGFVQPQLVIGTTAHESHSETLLQKYTNWTSEQVRKYVQESQIGAKGLTDEVFKRYNDTYQGLVSIISDIRTVCPLLELHRALPLSTFYVVTQTGGPNNVADDEADIQAILGRYEPVTVEERRYMSSIQQVFYYYASHGTVPQTLGRKKILDIGQDPLSKDNWPVCDFWIANDFVPRYARAD